MKLKQVINHIPYTVLKGNLDGNIEGIAYDSRQVKPGFLFVCITGFTTDGHLYAQAVHRSEHGFWRSLWSAVYG